MKSFNRFFAVPALGLALVGLTACGSGGKPSALLKNVAITTSVDPVSGDSFLSLSSQLKTGNATIVNITVPVTKDGVEIGQVSVVNNVVTVSVNMTEVAHATGSGGTMPNGNPIPVTGLDPASIIQLAAGDKADVYASASSGLAMLGFALRIKAFDSIGKYVGPISICDEFKMDSVHGTACTFFSAEKGKSGFAVFADATVGATSLALNDGALADALSDSLSVASVSSGKAVKLRFLDRKTSDKKLRHIEDELYELHSRRARLH